MPEFYTDIKNNRAILVVNYSELVPRFYSSVASLCNAVRRSEKRGYGLRRITRGHNMGVAQIEYDSLPMNVREQMDDPRREVQAVEGFYNYLLDAERFYMNYMLPDNRRIAADIQVKYAINASTIEAVLALKGERERLFARCNRRPKKLWEGLCADAISFKEIQRKRWQHEHTLPENYRRFKEACEAYEWAKDKQVAYECLISGKHISCSVTGARKVDTKMYSLFESLFTAKGYKPNYKDVYDEYMAFLRGEKEIVSNETGEVLSPAEYKEVSPATVRAYLTRWESKAATLRLRTGDRQKLMGETKPYHSMAEAEYAGSLLSVDDRQPPFEYGDGKRVWFYLGYDLGADCYTTIVWGRDKKGIILDFYRQMVRNYAEWGLSLPAELEAESNLNASYKETFLREGNMFEFVRIEANNARGKKIENRNRAMRYGDERRSEGWIARPFAGSEANRAGVERVTVLPFDTIVEQTLRRYEKWNNDRHPRHTEMSRWEFFMKRQNPNLKPINWFGIIPFLGIKVKSSCHTGIVRLCNSECLLGIDGRVAVGEELIGLMKLVEGEELTVRYLDGNDGKVLKAFAYMGEQFVCELVQKPIYSRARVEQTAGDIANREVMSKYVATIEGYGNRRKKGIEKVTVIEGERKSEYVSPEYRFFTPQTGVTPTVESATNSVFAEILPEATDEDLKGDKRSFKRSFAETF
ncbi:MAG: hypothetical protein RRY55_01185 [Bacteroidales bacterium]